MKRTTADACLEEQSLVSKKACSSSNSGQLSMMAFLKKDTEKTQQNVKATAAAATICVKKRKYSKYKCVCLICATNKQLKNKSIAILSRGGSHFIERHRKRNHPKLVIEEMKEKIVPFEHALVPTEIRKLSSTASLPRRKSNITSADTDVSGMTTSNQNNVRPILSTSRSQETGTQNQTVTPVNDVTLGKILFLHLPVLHTQTIFA